MPDVGTSRTRDVTIAGGGGFGVDSASVFLPLYNIGAGDQHSRKTWFAGSEVSYWGKSVQVQVTVDPHFSSIAGATVTPSVTLTIFYGGFSKSVTVNGTSYTQSIYTEPARSAIQYFDTSTGSFSFTEVVHCVQHVNPNPYEVRTGTSFTCSASISAHFVDTVGGGGQTISASLTMTDADVAGFASEAYTGYAYIFTFGGIGVNFDNSATIGFDQPGLISTFSGANTTYGKPTLTGSGTGATFHWAGGTGDLNSSWSLGEASAALEFRPSWAMSVESRVYHYKDGTEVGATLDHYYGTDLVGSFVSGSAYRYPASGLIDYVLLDFFDSGANNAGTGMQPGVIADYTLTGSNYGPVGLLFQKPGDPIGGTTTFRVNPAWANGYATYTPSLHPTPPPTSGSSGIAVKVLQPYQQGTIEWDSTHVFGLFEVQGTSTTTTADVTSSNLLPVASSAGFHVFDLVSVAGLGTSTILNIVSPTSIRITSVFGFVPSGTVITDVSQNRWVAFGSGPTFPGVTSPWDSAPALTLVSGVGIDGNALQVTSNGPASVGTQMRYLLKHQGFRYAHLRVKASPPSTTLTGNVSAGDTDLPVASSAGFHTGDHVTLGAETLIVASEPTAGHIPVSPLGTGHSSGAAVTRTGASRVMFSLQGSSAGTAGWLVTPPEDGSWVTVDLDLAKPDYKVPSSTWLPNSDLYPPSLFFPDPSGFGYQGAQVTVLPLDAGTFTFDWLEGYRKTDGTRTPILFFPFLDGRGDLKAMGEYDDPDLIIPTSTDTVQVMTWVVNGVRGATIAAVSSVVDVEDLWDHLFNVIDTVANDTGIAVVEGVLGDPDPLSVFGPLNQGKFEFDGLNGYGLKPVVDTPFVVHGQIREFPVDAEAYYGAGDILSATGGYDAVVAFHLDWLFDGEAIVSMTGDLSGPPVVTLADNDTGTAISSGSPDDDGMVRLPAKYGVVYPYDNTDGSAEWTAGPPAPPDPASYTTLGKLLNSDWLKATNVSDPEDSEGYVEIGSPLGRVEIVILDRYQNFLYLHATPAITGVDLTTTLVGVHIVCNLSNRPVVKTTRDAGAHWDMADLADPCDADAIPTIARDRRDYLYVWDHTTVAGTPYAVYFRSLDYGANWEHHGAVITGLKYPRMANGLTRHFVAGHNGDTLVVYGSTDEAMASTDWDLLSTVAAPMQLAGFRSDRRGRLHLVYVDTLGTIVQRMSDDGIDWTDPAVAIEAVSTKPTPAFALEKGVVVLWTGTTLFSQPIKANLLDPDGAPVDTTLVLPIQYVGMEADRHEHYWLAGQLSGASLLVAYTKDGRVWSTI